MTLLGNYYGSVELFYEVPYFPRVCSSFDRLKKLVEVLDAGPQYAKYGKLVISIHENKYILGPRIREITQSNDKMNMHIMSESFNPCNKIRLYEILYCNPDGFVIGGSKYSSARILQSQTHSMSVILGV